MKAFRITRNERMWGIDTFGDVCFTYGESVAEVAKNLGLEARDPGSQISYFIPPRAEGQTMFFISETREISNAQEFIQLMQKLWR